MRWRQWVKWEYMRVEEVARKAVRRACSGIPSETLRGYGDGGMGWGAPRHGEAAEAQRGSWEGDGVHCENLETAGPSSRDSL